MTTNRVFIKHEDVASRQAAVNNSPVLKVSHCISYL